MLIDLCNTNLGFAKPATTAGETVVDASHPRSSKEGQKRACIPLRKKEAISSGPGCSTVMFLGDIRLRIAKYLRVREVLVPIGTLRRNRRSH